MGVRSAGAMTLLCAIAMLVGCRIGLPDPQNQAPYPVTGPTQTPTFQAYQSADQYYQLEIAQVGGQSDPDGDRVYFRSSGLPAWDRFGDGELVTYMELDEDTGLVTILGFLGAAGPPAGVAEVEFWSEDAHGAHTRDAPFIVTFTLSDPG